MTLATLVVKIGADVRGLVNGLRTSQNMVTSFGKRMRMAGMHIYTAGRSMTTYITAPLLLLGYAILKTGSDFESAFAGVRKTVNASKAGFEKLRQGIRNMAKELPQTHVEIAGIMEAAGQLGIRNKNLLLFTRVMADLGVATNLTSHAAAILSARFANITQMPERQFKRLGSTIVHLGNNLATTEREVLEMGLRIAGAGHQVGMAEHEILGMAGALSSLGVKVESGGSAASRILIYMNKIISDGGTRLQLMSKVAGQTVGEFSQLFKRDAASAVVSFVEGLGRIQKAGGDTFKILEDLGYNEIRLRDATLRLAGGGKQLRRSLLLAEKAWIRNNALTKEARRRYKTMESQWLITKNRIKDVAITIYDELRPAIADFLRKDVGNLVDKLRDLGEWFKKLNDKQKVNVVRWVAIAAAAGPVLIVIGLIGRGVGTLVSAIGLAIPVIRGLATALMFLWANPIALLIAAIVALAVLIILNWETIKTKTIEIWNSIKEHLSAAWAYIKDLWGRLMATDLMQSVVETWDTVFQATRSTWNQVVGFVRAAWQKIKAGAEMFWAAFGPYIKMMWTILKTSVGVILDGLVTVVKVAWEVIKSIINTVMAVIKGIIMTSLALIRLDWGAAWNAIKTMVVDAWNGMLGSIKGIGNAIVDFAAGLPGRILGALGDLKNLLVESGKDVMTGFLNGIKNIPIVGDAVQIVDGVVGAVKGALDSDSPSRVFMKIGEDTMKGLSIGLAKHNDELIRNMKKTMGAISIGPDPRAIEGANRGVARASQVKKDGAIATTTPTSKTIEAHFHGDTMADPKRAIKELDWMERTSPW